MHSTHIAHKPHTLHTADCIPLGRTAQCCANGEVCEAAASPPATLLRLHSVRNGADYNDMNIPTRSSSCPQGARNAANVLMASKVRCSSNSSALWEMVGHVCGVCVVCSVCVRCLR
jgi:hypothetical protein